MKQQELKLLAGWYYKGENRELVCSEKTQSIFTRNQKTKRLDEVLCLDHQLDMLEDKMIEEWGIDYHFTLLNKSAARSSWEAQHVYGVQYTDDSQAITGKGKTKKEARLNAILSYVKSIKEKK